MSAKLSATDLSRLIQNQMDRYKADGTVLLRLGKHAIEKSMWRIFKESLSVDERRIYITNEKWECDRCRTAFYPVCNVFHFDEDMKVVPIWKDILDRDTEFFGWENVIRSLSDFMCSSDHWTRDAFPGLYPAYFEVPMETMTVIGVEFNDKLYADEVSPMSVRFHHIHYTVPEKYLVTYAESSSKYAKYGETVALLERLREKIKLSAVDEVLGLIDENNLYRGSEMKPILLELKEFLEGCSASLDREVKTAEDEWYFIKYVYQAAYDHFDDAHIRGTAIGTLLEDLSDGLNIDYAVRSYEQKVAPENYRRTKTLYTKADAENAKKTLIEYGLAESISRRFAIPADISVSDMLFVYTGKETIKSSLDDIFDDMKSGAKAGEARDFDHVKEIPYADFEKAVLPKAVKVEAYVENKHAKNLMSLIAPGNRNAKPITRWDNGFTWAYNGNIADSSSIAKRVKDAGGKIEGDLRFSIQWNDGEIYNKNDLDAHCIEHFHYLHPREFVGDQIYHIYFQNKTISSPNGGILDVDVIDPISGIPAVENIVYADRMSMKPGTYTFAVHEYNHVLGDDGFRAEIEINGTIYHYDMKRNPACWRQNVVFPVAEVTVDEYHNLSIKHLMPHTTQTSQKPIWGILTNNFIPVDMIMKSPNYWGENSCGNEHRFFILKDCKNPDTPNGFYNEFLLPELRQHRKVFEILGEKMRVNPSDEQVSGLGFSLDKRADLVVKVTREDNTSEIMKIKF